MYFAWNAWFTQDFTSINQQLGIFRNACFMIRQFIHQMSSCLDSCRTMAFNTSNQRIILGYIPRLATLLRFWHLKMAHIFIWCVLSASIVTSIWPNKSVLRNSLVNSCLSFWLIMSCTLSRLGGSVPSVTSTNHLVVGKSELVHFHLFHVVVLTLDVFELVEINVD